MHQIFIRRDGKSKRDQMDENVLSFGAQNQRKRKLWQQAVTEFVRSPKQSKHRQSRITQFISSIWKLGSSQFNPGSRKRLRYHDSWHNLQALYSKAQKQVGVEDEISVFANESPSVDGMQCDAEVTSY